MNDERIMKPRAYEITFSTCDCFAFIRATTEFGVQNVVVVHKSGDTTVLHPSTYKEEALVFDSLIESAKVEFETINNG